MYKNYLKDNIHRHKREKEIDQHLFDDMKVRIIIYIKKSIQEKVNKIKDHDKLNQKIERIKLNRKRFRENSLIQKNTNLSNTVENDEPAKKEATDTDIDFKEKSNIESNLTLNEEVKKEKEFTEKNSKIKYLYHFIVNIKYALEKILKHIRKEDNFNKCFSLLKSLLIKYESLSEFVILKILLTLMDLDFRCKDLSNTKKLEGKFLKN